MHRMINLISIPEERAIMFVATKCSVFGCKDAARARGYCFKHYQRFMDHGEVEPVRLSGRGTRETHPLYTTWTSLRRYKLASLCVAWRDDFWALVDEVKAKPEGALRPSLQPIDSAKPVGPGNWYWRIPIDPVAAREKREYMREWAKKARASDPLYWKGAQLKRQYGVTLEWYQQQLTKQNGGCAICGKPETMEIKGKVVSLSVDHCHDTGFVRGLLCDSCNRGIGMLQHDVALLKRAIMYIQSTDEHFDAPTATADREQQKVDERTMRDAAEQAARASLELPVFTPPPIDAAHRAEVAARAAERNRSDEHRAKVSAGLRANPEALKAAGERIKRHSTDPELLAKRTEAIRAAYAKPPE